MTTIHTYEWNEWVDAADRSHKAGNHGGTHGRDDWAGCSAEKAVRMARHDGYQDAVPEAEAFAAHVSTVVVQHTEVDAFVASFDVSGAEVDMGRYLEGVPECMVESAPIKISGAGRAVRIAIPICYSATVSEDTIRRRGAAVMALATILQLAKHPLEIWAGYATYAQRSVGSDDRIALMARVQAPDQPFDAGRVMYALAHPSMLRRLGFAVADTLPHDQRVRFGFTAGGGYGNGQKGFALKADDLDEVPGTTIIVPDNDRRMQWTEGESVAWIEEQLRLIFEDS